MEKKYELVMDNSIVWSNRKLYRVRALRDFANVKKGDIGGYIQSEDNLSQKGNCWVDDNAKVYEAAKISGNAEVYNDAKVCGRAKIYDNAVIYENAEVYGNAKVYGDALVHVYAEVYDNAKVYDKAEIGGYAEAYDNALVYDYAEVCGEVKVRGEAKIYQYTTVDGVAQIDDNAEVENRSDYFSISSVGSANGIFTAYKCEDGIIRCNRGCFKGTIDEFKAAVLKMHGENQYAKEYMHIIEFAKVRLG